MTPTFMFVTGIENSYWSKMPSLPQRMRILSDWVLDLLFGRNLARPCSDLAACPTCGPVDHWPA